MFSRVILIVVILISLASCTSNSGVGKRLSSEAPASNALMHFEEISAKWREVGGAGRNYLDSYTSLIISSNLDDYNPSNKTSSHSGSGNNDRSLYQRDYESRTWFSRLFVDKITSSTLTMEVSTPDYSTTVPLVILEYSSTRENGDQWYRMLAVRREAFPLFLVKQNGQNSKVGLKFNVHKSHESNSNAGQLLKTTLNTLETVTPSLTVVTTLNKHFTESSKEAIDKSLSANFSKSLQEDLIRDISLLEIEPGSNIQVTFKDTLSDSIFVDGDLKKYARWRVTFDYPRPSVFSAFRICTAFFENNDKSHEYATTDNGCKESKKEAISSVLDTVSGPEILDFSLVFGSDDEQKFGTIGSYLRQQSWFSDYISSGTNLEDFTPVANKLCRSIKNAMIGVNLNSLDAELVVWAVKKNMPLSDNAINALNDVESKDCKTMKDDKGSREAYMEQFSPVSSDIESSST